jgi:hypothetical protein
MGTVNLKFTLEQATKAQRVSIFIALLFLEPRFYMWWVVKATPQPLYPRERPCTHYIGGWVGPRAGLDACGNLASTGIRSPERPARSESLYRLDCPGDSTGEKSRVLQKRIQAAMT